MFDWSNVVEEYANICKNGNYNNITKIFCLSCVEESLKWLERDTIETESERIEKAQVVYDYYLDTDIQISKISDIICEHWKEYVENENFDIYEHIKF